jgi:hypothetical protein
VQITVRVEKIETPNHWVTITLSTWTPREEERAVGYSNTFRCSIQPLDQDAENFHLEIWESGILSGLIYVFRRSEMKGVLVQSIEGHLSSEDIEGVAYASTVAGIRATGSKIVIPSNQNWLIKDV